MTKLPVPVTSEEVALTLAAQQICDLIVGGFRLPEIAQRLEMSRSEVRRHLVEVNRRVLENGLLKRDHLRAQVYTDYEHLLSELEDAFEKSKPGAEPTFGDDEKGRMEYLRAKAMKNENYVAGDARYLKLALDILKQKRQMLGLDEPKRIERPPLPDTAGPQPGEDYVMQLHERFVTIQRNMRRQPIPDAPELPTPVEEAPAPAPDANEKTKEDQKEDDEEGHASQTSV